VKNPLNEYTRRLAAESLGKIDKDNPVAIAYLVELIRNSGDEDTRRQAADSLGAIDKDNPVAISALVELIGTSQDNNNRRQAAEILEKICQDNRVAIVAVSGLKDCLTSEIYENDFNRYEICYTFIWSCAQNMTYPEFYQAWHTQPTNLPIPDRNHPQNTDIATLLKQLQPTDKTLPVPLNIRALEGETNTSPIAFRVLYPTISSNLPRRCRHSRNSQRPRIQAINSATQKSPAKTAHRLNFALVSLRRCAFIFGPQTRRRSNGNSYRLDYRYTAGIALNKFSAKSRGLAECGTELDSRDWFVIQGPDTPPYPSVTT
jgi:hypothetical protein